MLEHADGHLQEEIKVLYEFLGDNVFKITVIIASNQKGRYQQYGFTTEDAAEVKKVFTTAYKKILKKELTQCPPVVNLLHSETNVLSIIHKAYVIHDPGHKLHAQDHRCIRCAGKFVYKVFPERKLTVKLHEQSGKPCEENKCHPILFKNTQE